jgi:hypothetical protein
MLGLFPRGGLPEVAAQATMAGFEGPFILDLVGYAAPSLHRLTDRVVEGAFLEMGRRPITEREAAVRLARSEALRILRNQSSCTSGAALIADLVRNWDDAATPPGLLRFEELFYDEYWEEHPEEFKQRVVELSWALLEEDPR